jgi:hypothetical protein
MDRTTALDTLYARLRSAQLPTGAWSFRGVQNVVEATSLAILALRHHAAFDLHNSSLSLWALQNRNGSWPAFGGDELEGCWTTALAVVSLMAIREAPVRLTHAIDWLVAAHGREANWFWRWKFQNMDRHVKFDPTKYGWSWVPGTVSWVIPTAFSLIALCQASNRGLNKTDELAERIETGTRMLLDRMCPGGGWNAGNGVAFGVPYSPYIDATAIALLALRGHVDQPGVQASFSWLMKRLPGCLSPYSMAWGILALAAYRVIDSTVVELLSGAGSSLISLIKSPGANDAGTLAICALALEAAEGENVFEVLA